MPRTVAPLEVVVRDVVEADQHQGAAQAAQHVGASSLEHRLDTLRLEDLVEAVNRAGVLASIATRRHHHATADGVKRVRQQTSNDRHCVRDGELGGKAGVLDERLRRVVQAEVGSAVEDDADARDNKAVVDTALAPAGLLGRLHIAISSVTMKILNYDTP